MKVRLFILALLLILVFIKPPIQQTILTKEQIVTAIVTDVIQTETRRVEQREYYIQQLKVTIQEGDQKDNIIAVRTRLLPHHQEAIFKEGDKILLGAELGAFEPTYYIIDYQRTDSLLLLLLLFIGVTVFITRKQSLFALGGLALSFLVIWYILLPLVINGFDPIITALLVIGCIVPLSFYFVHGMNLKTSAAVLSTLLSLGIASLLAVFFVNAANITGITHEDVEILIYSQKELLQLKSLIIAGIIISCLAVLDDITVSQISVVEQLLKTKTDLSISELYHKASQVGRDHIASIVNTLLLVYVGSSLVTLLVFIQYPRPLSVFINREDIALQIVASLVGSIAIMIAVPISTVAGIFFLSRVKQLLGKRHKE